ncbi:Set3 complex subunit with deacetylase activity, meiotic-specific repressor of sporulation proteins [Orbilia oligospora]|nr:Set3 complex subunit with deacetylase activity, meiotic-specific repressor of sporulation proteins [Orbilia oligospora]KAF3254322.1 Set3 complex subunit with deacetylase activity, meiotic-specific repressor of sporulation proteins [Orbilia oligospora]KAF3255502.1 Set3 complex subunit with deacetylase activity, meiotic-specific repressor of sporulation proteins [Orbilia oligospora]KAF3295809.1 Set3 complex subunit with deacetylase activity, meiotic-specific repressor of sporulation proteins [O
MTSTISLPVPTPVPPAPPSLSSSSPVYGMNGITGLNSISSSGHCSSSGINSSDGRIESLNSTRNGKLLSMSSAVGINGGTGQQAHSSSSSSHLPTLNEPPKSSSAHQDSDSDAETVVVAPQSRGRSRSNRPRSYPENDDNRDDDRLAPSSHSRRTNGDSKSRPDRDNDDAYSSDLSSAPSSRAPSSKRPLPKDRSRKRTASPSRLTHSPPRRKIPKIQEDDLDKRRSLKRKAREVSHERGIKSEDESPRGIRIKSSPPMSPPPVPRESNGTKHARESHTSTNNTSSTILLSRPGHSRKRSVPNVGSSSGKTPSGINSSVSKFHKTKRSGRPPALSIQDSDNEVKSTSSSRSNSPHITNHRRRRPSISGPAASPARLIGPGHKMKRDKTGRNQLHKVCAKGVLDEAKACLEAEPDLLNDADNAGYLPIHAAALAGHDDIVEWLIEEGALVDKPAEDLSTPLLDAVENMHVAVVNTLLEHGADPRHRNKAGQSSIDLASTIRQQSDEADEEAKMSQIEDALRAALVKLKNKKRADDEARKTANESCSSRAASVASPSHFSPPPQSNQMTSSRRRGGRGEPTRNEFLWLDAGKGGQAKLKQASRDGDMEMAGKLLESGINPDPESMMLAARGGHLDVLNLLVAFGGDSDPDPKDVIRQHTKDKSQFPLISGEETPLLATIGRNNIEVLKLLLRSESMKEPRRLDNRGRSYAEIAKQRGGENWEEEVKLLQAAYDSAGPQKSKKSARDKLDSSSPVASRKDKDKDSSKDKDRKSERKEAKADEMKKTKRLRRRSASPAASSAMDDTAPSEREISPVIARSKLKDLDKQKRKERAVDSDYSAISDSNATVDGTKTKKRRLVLGKDLAAKSEKEDKPPKIEKDDKKEKTRDEKPSRKRSDEMEVDHPVKREKEKDKEKDVGLKEKKKKEKAVIDEDDIEMPDAPRPKKRLVDPERHASKRDHSLDKRQRESSSSSNRPVVNDHNSDVDAQGKVEMLGKKRRKLEDEADAPAKAKSKEERQSEVTEERPKSKEERKAEREIRRAEADKAAKMKLKAEKSEKPASTDIVGKDTDEALLERKREKKKRREEALREQAKEATTKESKDSETAVSKRSKERETVASDIEGKKSRSEKERSVHKDKDAMDVDSEVPTTKRRKPSGDSAVTPDDVTSKIKKRKSNGASPAPSANDEKNGNRHLNDLSNGKSNRGSSIREEVKPKADPNDDAMLTEEREREIERQRIEKEQKELERKKQEAARQQEEKRREQERLDQERAAEKLRLQKQQEEERRKQLESMRQLGVKLYKTSSYVQLQSHDQAQSQLAGDKARFDEMQRINSLPLIYRDALMAKNKEEFAHGLWQDYRRILPLYCVEYGEPKERWVSNAQACVLLGIPHDLEMTIYPNLERRPVNATEQQALKQNFHVLYSSYNSPQTLNFDVRLEMERQETEQNKFLALTNVFWLKASDLCKIFLSNDRYRHIADKFIRNSQLPSVLLWIEGED